MSEFIKPTQSGTEQQDAAAKDMSISAVLDRVNPTVVEPILYTRAKDRVLGEKLAEQLSE